MQPPDFSPNTMYICVVDIIYTCIVTTRQGFQVPESIQNGIQHAKRSSQMVKLQSGRHYVKALAKLIVTFTQSDRLSHTSQNLSRYTYSFPKH